MERLFFRNVLTHYLRKEEVDKELEFDMIIPAAPCSTDITSIRGKKDDDGLCFTSASIRLVMIVLLLTFMGC